MTKRIIILVLFSFLFQFSSYSQWEEVSFPIGDVVNDIIQTDNYLWFLSGNQLMRSRDGIGWQSVKGLQLEDKDSGEIVQDGNRIFVFLKSGDNEDKVYFSNDEGKSWGEFFHTAPVANSDFLRVSNNTFIYKETNKVFRSVNVGVDWDEVFFSGEEIMDIQKFDTDWLMTTRENIYRSTDDGLNWQVESAPYSVTSALAPRLNLFHFEEIAFLFQNDPIGGFYRSFDNGQTWEHSYPDFLDESWWVDDVEEVDGNFYLASSEGVYVSFDKGETWQNINLHTLPSGICAFRDRILVGTSNGIFSTDDLGANWTTSNFGHNNGFFNISQLHGFNIVKDEIYLGTFDFFYKSKNLGGFEWESIREVRFYRDNIVSGDTLFIMAQLPVVSFDNGITWDTVPNPPNFTGSWINSDLISHKGSLFYSNPFGDSGYSDDWGQTWTPFQTEFEQLEGTTNFLYGIERWSDGDVLVSADKGVTFTELSDGLPSRPRIEDIFTTEDKAFLYADDLLFRLVNDRWEPATTGLFDITGSLAVRPFQFVSKDNIVVMMGQNNSMILFYISFDNGQSWASFASPNDFVFGGVNGATMELVDGVLYIGGEMDDFLARPKIFRQALSDFNLAKIGGTVFEDINGNGQRDTDDPPLGNILIQSKQGNSISKSIGDGSFNMYSIFTTQEEIISAISPSPYAQVTTPEQVISEPVDNLEFGIQFESDAQDLCIDLTSSSVFRPGFESNLIVTVKNVATRYMLATVQLDLPNELEYLDATVIPDRVNGNVLIWENIELARFEQMSLGVSTRVPVNVMINTPIEITATVNPITGDRNPENNVDKLSDVVVGSFDPNDKQVSTTSLTPEEVTTQPPLEYTIRFQNTGNFPADFIHILDTLDTQLDFSTFEILSHSHPMTYSVGKVGELDFFFEMINLPDSTANEAESHGFVKFQIAPNATLMLGDVIENQASIYFDYNAPIHTNKVETIVQIPTSVDERLQNLSFKITPNPTVDQGFIEFDFDSNEAVVSIVKLDGKIVWREKITNGSQTKLPKMPRGTYFVNIKTSEGFGSEMWQVIN